MTATPLNGLKVLELARILAGPWAGQLLADLGADVLKVESNAGDDTRKWGPPFIGDVGNCNEINSTEDAAYFHSCNRGKRSVIVDISSDEGQATIIRLIKDADVIIENFKVGGLKKYGLDYQSLSRVNPRLIYCSITGFGQTGPRAQQPGYDLMIQGISGIMELTGEASGPPQKMGVAFADIFTGTYAVVGIQAAIAHREKTGEGQHIDMSLLDTMTSVMANQNMNYLVSGQSPTRLGNKHPNIAPYQAFQASDGWFNLAVGNDQQFAAFCDVAGLGPLEQDERFSSNGVRVKNREALEALISNAVSKLPVAQIVAKLTAVNVPAGPINTLAETYADPQIQFRELVMPLQREGGTEIPSVRNPIKFSKSTMANPTPSPELGEHNAEWLDNE